MGFDPYGHFAVSTCYGDINLLNRDYSDFGGGGGGRTNTHSAGTLLGTVAGAVATFELIEWFKEIEEKLTKSLAVAASRTYRTDFEEHHIAAKSAFKAREAATILNEVLPGGVEDPLNKVMLKTSVHRRIHTNVYYSAVNWLIVKAYQDAGDNPAQQYSNVVSTLGKLKAFLTSLNELVDN